ncbi:MAG: aromatic amino acid aminotransferase [Ktedonobacter sp. 13_1_20CM_4_53_11]|nr:MAG: aromatic amino acid aminotransferase [Ktedonobacter sp. 13_2_20CM_53_11]OLB59762.1 MAG: aromatic amino acid aminotransferase [Ktedonobacter sp. 13_2_20CM_2_54_8]OLE07362.1 MAG: aromatic amino acid aminotransferase [Ktedonobacter sp. 13_1_20CM_4_53_11]TMC22133.1 MAG: aminotransferase class I/II-fold pyridoxal phosphate-dependent enzyme [Chloroflexota bacterium]TMC59663.1 MAG: aminotransferase class I/II-fold pyridoxal phosphate-dependent enzyme [Chloroflexota bacterium]
MDTLRREVLSQRVRQVKPSGIRKFFDIINTMPDVISLGVGEPDFVTPGHIRQAGIRSIELGHTRYTSNYGMLELREELAAMLHRRYGLTYDPKSELLVTVGVSEGVDLAMRTIIDPGDEVISPDPGYVAYEADVIFAGGVPVTVPTYAKYEFAVRASEIAPAITPRTKMILIGNPNNPTGAVIPQAELEGIAKLAIEHDLIVAIDEVYSRLVYDHEHRSIASLPGMRERTILLDGFSKAYAMTGWRIGYVAAPAPILEAMLKIHQYAIMCAGTAPQEAALEALRHGEDDILMMHEAYARRRRMFVDGLNRIGLPCCEPRGAFYAFPYIGDLGLTDEEFAEKLLFEEHVAVVPGSAFGTAGAGYVRCAYCSAFDQLEEALVRMERFLKKYSSGSNT